MVSAVAPSSYLDSLASPTFSQFNDDGSGKGAPGPFDAELIARGATALAELVTLRRKGWEEQVIDEFFAQERQAADTADNKLNTFWMNRMMKVFEEIDTVASCVPASGPLRFLDLGCCPGGFSSYMLTKNPNSTGLGVSLPLKLGGHKFAIPAHLQQGRMSVIFTDITKYIFSAGSRTDLVQLPSALRSPQFDFVIMDGHHLRTNTTAGPHDANLLLIGQVMIAFKTLKSGGTMMMKLHKAQSPTTMKLLYMLDSISSELFTAKPKTMHAKRGSFYAVAKGIRPASARQYVAGWRALWLRIIKGGDEGGIGHDDLDFILSDEDLRRNKDGCLDRMVELGQPIWEGQAGGLRAFYKRQGLL